MTGSVISSIAVSIGAFLFLHIVIWRARPSNSPRIFLLALLAAVGMGISLLVNIRLTGFSMVELCAILWFDVFAAILYFFVYAGIARSVSVTLLSRLYRCSDQTLDFDTLVDEYTTSSRFEDRIHLMHNSGLLQVKDNDVSLTRKGFVLARLARVLGQIIGNGLQG